MSNQGNQPFITGVIEGFYGRAWSPLQRLAMIDLLAASGLNTYLYAPKFDLHHRWNWREPYPAESLQHFRELCQKGRELGINVILSISPGLSVSLKDTPLLIQRFSELARVEPGGLALLLDDIPYEMANPADHVDLATALIKQVPGDWQWFFCPTAYSDYHLRTWNKAEHYLAEIGLYLPIEFQLFWTGKTVISRTISGEDLNQVQQLAGRKPVIWDNYLANDYVPANAFFPGPLEGRSSDLRDACAGVMVNPSEIFCASQMAVLTLAEWATDSACYEPLQAFEKAVCTLAPDHESAIVLHDLFGYFYTPFSITVQWQDLLKQMESFYRDTGESPLPDLLAIRERLRNEGNIFRMPEMWVELYPFVRTLLGDLDYLIDLCKQIKQNGSKPPLLPPRDPRWSTPVGDLINHLRQ